MMDFSVINESGTALDAVSPAVIKVIGCGGVLNGKDAFEHLLCGASMVQVGSQLMKETPSIFAKIVEELTAIMKEKGYNSIEDFRGKLKSL